MERKKRREQNVDEKIEEALLKKLQASPSLRLCAFTNPHFLLSWLSV